MSLVVFHMSDVGNLCTELDMSGFIIKDARAAKREEDKLLSNKIFNSFLRRRPLDQLRVPPLRSIDKHN